MLSLGADILESSNSGTPGGRMRAQISFVVAPTKPADMQFTAQKMMRRMSRGFDLCLSRQQRAATNSGTPIAPSKDLSGLGSMDLTVGPNGRVTEFKIAGFPGLDAFGRQCFQRRAKRLRFPTQDVAVQLVVRGQIKMRRAPIPRMRRFDPAVLKLGTHSTAHAL